MMNAELFAAGSTIGADRNNELRAANDCLVLDPTEFLVISDEIEELDENFLQSLIVERPPPSSPAPSDSGVSTSIRACDHSLTSSGYDSPNRGGGTGGGGGTGVGTVSGTRPLSFRSSSSSESIDLRSSPQTSALRRAKTTKTKIRAAATTTKADSQKGRRRSEADVAAQSGHRRGGAPKMSGLGMLQEEMQHLIDRMGEKSHAGVIMTPRRDTRSGASGNLGASARVLPTEPPRLLFSSSASVDIDDLPETCVDSDDDDTLIGESVTTSSSRDSLSDIQDPVYESMEKMPSDRTENDIDLMHDYLQYLPAFSGHTETIRRQLCAKICLHKFLHGMEVVPNGRELSSWYVILYGQLDLMNHGKNAKTLFSGESFGITAEASKSIHQGSLVVKSDHCKILEVKGEDFKEILHSGEQNIRTVTEDGKPVLVQEQRGAGDRVGYVIIRGTQKRLLDQLVEANPADPNYAEDFLLCHRTFIEGLRVARQLLEAFEDAEQRPHVTRVMLLWVNNHFGDFDGVSDMMDCLEKFREKLEEERMGEHLRMLDVAVTTKSKTRDVVLKRDDVTAQLGMTIIGRNDHVYVSHVEKGTISEKAKIRIGDEIISVNDVATTDATFERVERALSDGKKFRIQVKYAGSNKVLQTHPSFTYSDDDDGSASPSPHFYPPPPRSGSFLLPMTSKQHEKGGKSRTLSGLIGKLTGRARKPKSRPAISSVIFTGSVGGGQLTPPPFHHNSREQTPDSESLSPTTLSDDLKFSFGPVHQSTSMPSIPLSPPPQLSSNIDHVIKIFHGGSGTSDGGGNAHSCYIPISNQTTAGNLVALAIREFSQSESACDYSLCQITTDSKTRSLQQKRLPDTLNRLPERLGLHSRYYIKPHNMTGTLVHEDVVDDILRDGAIHIANLDLDELVRHLTVTDFVTFRQIQHEEYIRDLFGCHSNEETSTATSTRHLAKFADIVNREMFWVVTEVCRETRERKRVKIIKRFVKIAGLCRRARNFNTMFAVVSGLGHRCVERLRTTWDRVPSKYVRAFESMQRLMDPTRNMSTYRTVINEESRRGPVIPFFPVVKKDLMVLYLTNESKVNGLINFEKLRKLSKEIRNVGRFASKSYDPNHVFGVETSAASGGELLLNPMTGTLKKRSGAGGANSIIKKMYEMKLMEKKVREYVANLPVIEDETMLEVLSVAREPPPGSGSGGGGGGGGGAGGSNGRASPQTRAMSVGSKVGLVRRNSSSSSLTRRLSVQEGASSASAPSPVKKRFLGGSPSNKKRRGSVSSRQSLSCNSSPLIKAKSMNH